MLVHVQPGRRYRARLSGAWMGRWPSAARYRSVDPPHLRPAAAARDEAQLKTAGRPARLAVAGGVLGHLDFTRPIRGDDPDGAVSNVRQSSTVGRPLRIADRLLRCRQLDG